METSDPRKHLPASFVEQAYSFTRQAVQSARRVFLDLQAGKCSSQQKADRSLVTEADKRVESLYVELILKHYPNHGIFAEEGGHSNSDSEFQWIIDPLDGTQSFVHGIPTYGSMLALWYQGWPLTGVIDHPGLNLGYHGAFEFGTWCNGERVSIPDSASPQIDYNEIILVSSRAQFELSGDLPMFDRLLSQHRHCRIYYDCFGLSRAIHGQAGAMLEINVPVWDLGPCRILVEEAGGKYCGFTTSAHSATGELYSAIFGKPRVVDELWEFVNTCSASTLRPLGTLC